MLVVLYNGRKTVVILPTFSWPWMTYKMLLCLYEVTDSPVGYNLLISE